MNAIGIRNLSKSVSDKSCKTKSRLSKSELYEVQIALELEENVQIRSYEDPGELRDVVMSYTKAIGEYTSKHTCLENALFSESAVEKAQTKVGKDGQNLIHLWKEMIQSFPMVSSDQAQAICAVYPSPLLLKQVFSRLFSLFKIYIFLYFSSTKNKMENVSNSGFLGQILF